MRMQWAAPMPRPYVRGPRGRPSEGPGGPQRAQHMGTNSENETNNGILMLYTLPAPMCGGRGAVRPRGRGGLRGPRRARCKALHPRERE